MTRDRITIADASKVSGADFARSLGLNIRTQAEKQDEWDAEVERCVKLILNGCEMSSYGKPAVAEAKRRIADDRFTEVHSDPLRRVAR